MSDPNPSLTHDDFYTLTTALSVSKALHVNWPRVERNLSAFGKDVAQVLQEKSSHKETHAAKVASTLVRFANLETTASTV